jgi:hypothetical protein
MPILRRAPANRPINRPKTATSRSGYARPRISGMAILRRCAAREAAQRRHVPSFRSRRVRKSAFPLPLWGPSRKSTRFLPGHPGGDVPIRMLRLLFHKPADRTPFVHIRRRTADTSKNTASTPMCPPAYVVSKTVKVLKYDSSRHAAFFAHRRFAESCNEDKQWVKKTCGPS